MGFSVFDILVSPLILGEKKCPRKPSTRVRTCGDIPEIEQNAAKGVDPCDTGRNTCQPTSWNQTSAVVQRSRSVRRC